MSRRLERRGGGLLMGTQGGYQSTHLMVIVATADRRVLCARLCPLCAPILQLEQLRPRDPQRAKPGWEPGTQGYLLSSFLVSGP